MLIDLIMMKVVFLMNLLEFLMILHDEVEREICWLLDKGVERLSL